MPSMERAQDIVAEVLLTRPEMTEAERDDLAAQIVAALDTEAEKANAKRREAANGVR
jgi:hypothetical protein